MCPRKSPEGKVARWAYTMYKQKARKLAFGPYRCPICGKDILNIKINKKQKEVIAVCSCDFKRTMSYSPVYQPIDYYNKLIDEVYQH